MPGYRTSPDILNSETRETAGHRRQRPTMDDPRPELPFRGVAMAAVTARHPAWCDPARCTAAVHGTGTQFSARVTIASSPVAAWKYGPETRPPLAPIRHKFRIVQQPARKAAAPRSGRGRCVGRTIYAASGLQKRLDGSSVHSGRLRDQLSGHRPARPPTPADANGLYMQCAYSVLRGHPRVVIP
jgi:hypothetical protein